jgi:hypothetical protein
MWNDICRNWKTSGAGLVLALAGLFRIFWPEQSETIQRVSEAVIVIAGTAIALFAKDGNLSGTAVNPRP